MNAVLRDAQKDACPVTYTDAGGTLERLEIGAALARELSMLDSISGGKQSFQLLVWQCEPCLVVPRRLAAVASFPMAARELDRRGFPVFIRNTGGDAVVQGPGTINVSVVFTIPARYPDRIGAAYQMLCAPLMDVLKARNVETGNGAVAGAMCDGAFNVTATGQARRHGATLAPHSER